MNHGNQARQIIRLYISEGELQKIATCADAEKVSPNMWARRVLTRIADTFTKLTAE